MNKHPGCLFKILSKKRRVLIRKKAIIWGGHLSISCTDSLEVEAWKVITKEAVENRSSLYLCYLESEGGGGGGKGDTYHSPVLIPLYLKHEKL